MDKQDLQNTTQDKQFQLH